MNYFVSEGVWIISAFGQGLEKFLAHPTDLLFLSMLLFVSENDLSSLKCMCKPSSMKIAYSTAENAEIESQLNVAGNNTVIFSDRLL